MKILVTGGAGFIGSHIVDRYIASGHEVAIIDNLSSGTQENCNPKAHFFDVDMRSEKKVAGVIARFKPEVINHHAAHLVVVNSIRRPAMDADINIRGLLHALQAGVRHGVKKVIFASSGGALYGECLAPADEFVAPAPASPYGIAKWASEQYLGYFAKSYGLSACMLRYANVYGPRQATSKESGVIALFCKALQENKSITVYGDGGATRDYVYVDDVARANEVALTIEGIVTVNIATGLPTTVKQLVEQLELISEKKFVINTVPKRPGEIICSILSPGKAAEELGWQPQVSFSQGLQSTWEWYTKQ